MMVDRAPPGALKQKVGRGPTRKTIPNSSFLIPNLIFRFIIVSHFFREVKPCLM